MKSLLELRKQIRVPLNDLGVWKICCRKTLLTLVSLITGAIAIPSSALAAAGDLDTDFGDGGKVTTDFTGAAGYDEATAMVAWQRGKIIVAGFSCTVPDDPNAQGPFNGTCDFSLARYNIDGSLDARFGIGGKVTTGFGAGTDDRAYAVTTQQGRIVVAGSTRDPATGNHAFAVARYDVYGRLDTTFGVGGKVTTSFPLGSFAAAEAVAVRGDFITVVGTAGVSFSNGVITGADFAVARYKRNGKLDASFGDGGLVTTDFPGSISDEGQAVVLQPDGKIVVAGFTESPSTGEDIALVRYNIDGSLDDTFGDGGLVVTDFFGDFDVAEAIAVQPDGKIVVAGITVNPELINPVTGETLTQEDFALARYNVDGSLDTTFGDGGMVVTDFFNSFDLTKAMALQPDGKILVVGVASTGVDPVTGIEGEDFALVRYNDDGSLDETFGVGGKVTTDFAGDLEQAAAVAIKDGRIIVVGSTFDPVTGEDFALAVYDSVED